jgi:hypothetical protein
MATTAQYTAQPIIEGFSVASTDTSRSAPATTTTLAAGPLTAAANGVGKRILRVTVNEVNAIGAGTANVVRFWVAATSSGTKYLLTEKVITAVTSSATAAGFRFEVPELVGLVLPGHATTPATIFASSHSAATYHVVIESGLL